MNRVQIKRILLGSQLLYVLFLIIWIIFAMVAAMFFDAPGSEENLGIAVLFASIWAYPLGLTTGIVGSWMSYNKHRFYQALWLNSIPLLWVIPIITVLIYANTGK